MLARHFSRQNDERKKLYSLWGQKYTNILILLYFSKSKIGAGKIFLVLVNTTSRNPFSDLCLMVWEVCPPPFSNDNKGLGEWGSGFESKVGRDDTDGGTLSLSSTDTATLIPTPHYRTQGQYSGGTRRHALHGHLQGFDVKRRDEVPPAYNIRTHYKIGVDALIPRL